MTLTPQKYILRMKEKAWYCSHDLLEAMLDNDWGKVVSVAKILLHMSGIMQLTEPYWVPLPTPEEAFENQTTIKISENLSKTEEIEE